MIQVNNLSKAYGRQVIFDEVTFTLNSGERVGLVGRNGHGKTTLLKLIMGEEQPDSGAISVPNGYRTDYLSQHISFKEGAVLKEACSSLMASEDGTDETYKAKAILLGLGFSDGDFLRSPSELSGGYQVRLNLAKVLISKPNLLLLDEPTNYLDIVSIRWLGSFLRNWRNELIMITHDRSFMDSITTHTMAIHRCRVRKIPGSTEKLYQQILLEEDVHEKTRMNEERKRKDIEQFINRFRAQATRAKAVQSRVKALNKRESLEKLTEMKNLDFEFNAAPFAGKWLIEARDLSFSFDPKTPALIEKFSFAIGRRDRIGVIGKNGKGKSTLLNLFAGELQPLDGTVTHHPNLKMGHFGQGNIERLTPDKTVEEEIMDAHPDRSRGIARSICGIMMFEGDNALKKTSILSGGEKSRVLLGKLLVTPANLLLLDEPTNHLDMESIDSLLEAIDAFSGAVAIVTHSEMILNAFAEKLIVFDDSNATVFQGTYQDFLDRVGWRDEMRERPAPRAIVRAQTGAGKKDIRRARAEVVAAKSKTIGPLKKRIAEVEGQITSLETQVNQDTEALLDASAKGDGISAAKLSKAIHEARKKIDSLFGELESLSQKLEEKSREFDEKLEQKG
ncbi:MAG: ATP-binding cassette domain-containing protein [Pseudomonadota bacterium]